MANQTIVATGKGLQSSGGASKIYLYDSGPISLAGMVITDDVIINMPADIWVTHAAVQCITPEVTATNLVVDLGDGGNSTAWVDGFDIDDGSATAGDWSVTTGVALTNGPDNMMGKLDGAAGTLNLDLEAVTGVVTEAVVRIVAVCVDVS